MSAFAPLPVMVEEVVVQVVEVEEVEERWRRRRRGCRIQIRTTLGAVTLATDTGAEARGATEGAGFACYIPRMPPPRELPPPEEAEEEKEERKREKWATVIELVDTSRADREWLTASPRVKTTARVQSMCTTAGEEADASTRTTASFERR